MSKRGSRNAIRFGRKSYRGKTTGTILTEAKRKRKQKESNELRKGLEKPKYAVVKSLPYSDLAIKLKKALVISEIIKQRSGKIEPTIQVIEPNAEKMIRLSKLARLTDRSVKEVFELLGSHGIKSDYSPNAKVPEKAALIVLNRLNLISIQE